MVWFGLVFVVQICGAMMAGNDKCIVDGGNGEEMMRKWGMKMTLQLNIWVEYRNEQHLILKAAR